MKSITLLHRASIKLLLIGSVTFTGAATLWVAPVAAQESEAAEAAVAAAQVNKIRFHLAPNPKFVNCLAADPDDPNEKPEATVEVDRRRLNDVLTLTLKNIKPGLAFSLFTVQRSQLLADGEPDPAFKNFGLAWYQSDVQDNREGRGSVTIRTILLDQIFGFDPDVTLPPTNTFHVGLWFDDPKDAAPCGFDVTKPTPFNGEHKAGPNAMISLPDAGTGLGPLCTNPDTSVNPARCRP